MAMSNDLYEAHFSWPETHPSSVIVTGSFDHWSWSTPLTKGPSDFYGTVKVPWGQRIEYKYIVDGNWCTAWNQPTVFDPLGNLNNYFISPSKPEPVPEPEPEPEMQPAEPTAPSATADIEKRVEETRPESAPETDDVVDTDPTTTAAAEEPAQATGSRPLVNLIPVNDTSADIVPTLNEIETHSPVGNLPTTRRSLETLASPPPGPEPVEKPTEEATTSSTSPVANTTTQPTAPARASSSRSLVNLIPVNDTSADIVGSPDNDIATHTPVGALTPRSVEPPTTTTDVAAAESPEPTRPSVAHSRSTSSRSLVALIPVNDTSSDIIGSPDNEIATHTPIRTTSGVESPAPAAAAVESPVPSKPVVQARKSSSRSLVALIPVNDTSADIISSPDNEIVTHTPVRAQTPRGASNGDIESPTPTRPSVESRKSSSRSLVALIPVNDTSADVIGSPDHEIVTHAPVDTQARRSPPPPKSAPEPEAPIAPAASAPANETPSEPARAPSPRTLVNLIPVNDTSADIITNSSDEQKEITTHAPISARAAAAAPKSQEQPTPAPAPAKPAETAPTPSAAPSLPSTPVKQPSQTRKEAQQPSTSDDGTDTVTVLSSSTTSTPLKPTASSTASAKQQQQSPPSASPKRFGSLRGSSTGSSLNLKRRSFIARVKSVFVPGHHGGDGEKDKDSHPMEGVPYDVWIGVASCVVLGWVLWAL